MVNVNKFIIVEDGVIKFTAKFIKYVIEFLIYSDVLDDTIIYRFKRDCPDEMIITKMNVKFNNKEYSFTSEASQIIDNFFKNEGIRIPIMKELNRFFDDYKLSKDTSYISDDDDEYVHSNTITVTTSKPTYTITTSKPTYTITQNNSSNE